MTRVAALVVVACTGAAAALADAPRKDGDADSASMSPAPATPRDAAHTDWARGLVIAGGVGLADRQAPNPAVARGTSRRKAEDAAKLLLLAAVPSLPLATGGTLADKLVDGALKQRIANVVDAAITLDADPETDGSWHVTLGVPLEAIRQAIAQPRVLGATGDLGLPVVVVTGVTTKPAIGVTVGRLAAPTLWVSEVPAWAKGAPRIKAKGSTSAAIDADLGKATDATLVVLVTKR